MEIKGNCISNISDEDDQGGDDVSSLLSELDEFFDHIPGDEIQPATSQDHTYMEVEIV